MNLPPHREPVASNAVDQGTLLESASASAASDAGGWVALARLTRLLLQREASQHILTKPALLLQKQQRTASNAGTVGIGQEIALAHAVTDVSGKASHVRVLLLPGLREAPLKVPQEACLERQLGESVSNAAILDTGPVIAHASADGGARTWVALVPWPAVEVDL